MLTRPTGPENRTHPVQITVGAEWDTPSTAKTLIQMMESADVYGQDILLAVLEYW